MINLCDFTLEELTEYFKNLGEASFRAKQVFSFIAKGCESIDDLTCLSKALREKLKCECEIFLPKVERKLVSKIDGTIKYLLTLSDGNIIETVAMKYHHGISVCVSSQVGCAMGCTFCASTLGGRVRNLTPGEITGQIIRVGKDLGERVSNIVVMGIGEPFDNYENLIKFLKNINNPEGVNLGYRHITVSTCGIVPKIIDFANQGMSVNLAVSLHAPTDEYRKAIMPIAKKYSLNELLDACRYYFNKTGRRITYEYALIEGKNSSDECARLLIELFKNDNCHINLIPVNDVKERGNVRVSKKRVEEFKNMLTRSHVTATVRRELGSDISASCGQLRNSAIEQ
ncbi:MAG: 23S rRNA (adenine(2503)-C(2))-methyltransferase RlmN [Clostridia bacterium]|nr:23S rRNA (adenine(2503)-C(2))-methyltransferase RlmN [Clostridia bacterium]